MEVLDRVYNAFSNLDRDYAKSKKTRTEFIRDKFGGDIEMGSMIILDAISVSIGEETPEDIQKLTFVKEIFEKIRESKDVLDSLPDFSFSNSSLFQELLSLTRESVIQGTGIRPLSQKRLRKFGDGALHFAVRPDGVFVAPFKSCKVLYAYNENILGLIQQTTQGSQVKLFYYYEKKNALHIAEISKAQVTKVLK